MILEKIREQLKNCGISRFQISKDTKVDQTVLFRIFHDTGGCNISTADSLCEYLGLELQSKPKNRRRFKNETLQGKLH